MKLFASVSTKALRPTKSLLYTTVYRIRKGAPSTNVLSNSASIVVPISLKIETFLRHLLFLIGGHFLSAMSSERIDALREVAFDVQVDKVCLNGSFIKKSLMQGFLSFSISEVSALCPPRPTFTAKVDFSQLRK